MEKEIRNCEEFRENFINSLECDILKLPEEVWKAILAPYAEKYGWRIA